MCCGGRYQLTANFQLDIQSKVEDRGKHLRQADSAQPPGEGRREDELSPAQCTHASLAASDDQAESGTLVYVFNESRVRHQRFYD